jgi:hypothetical protein
MDGVGFPCPVVGDTFSGFYDYSSATGDIDCSSLFACDAISGALYFPDGFHPPSNNPIDFHLLGTFLNTFSVVNGKAVDFEWDGQVGGLDFSFNFVAFGMRRFNPLHPMGDLLSGTVSVGDPQLAVPDPPTIVLLGIGIATLLAYGKRKSCV